MKNSDYPLTSHFIQKCRDYTGNVRLKHVSKNLGIPHKLLKDNEHNLIPILQFVKKLDNKYHDIEGWDDSETNLFFDLVLHNHIGSDIRSLIVLSVTKQNYQANMVLRHLIECIIITLWADLISRFTGAFNYLLEDTTEWKPYRMKQRVRWKNDDIKNRNKSIKERLEKIRLNNTPQLNRENFYDEYFSTATDCDFRLLFSLPICKTCMKKNKKVINYEEFHLDPKISKLGKEDIHAIYKTNFGHTCNFCNKTKETLGFANGIPDLVDMLPMLKSIISDKRISRIDILNDVYHFLSNEFVHFSATRHPDSNPPLCYIKNLNSKKKIWGLSGIKFCLKISESIFELYFEELKKTHSQIKYKITKSEPKKTQIASARCPLCAQTAKSAEDVKQLFGLRIFNGRTYVQSYCKSCRGY